MAALTLWICNKSQTRPSINYIRDILTSLLSHESDDGKYDEAGECAGCEVDEGDKESICVHGVVKLVVRCDCV